MITEPTKEDPSGFSDFIETIAKTTDLIDNVCIGGAEVAIGDYIRESYREWIEARAARNAGGVSE